MPGGGGRKPWLIAAVVLLLAGTAVLSVLVGSGRLLSQQGETDDPELLKAQGTPPAPDLLRIQGSPSGPDLIKDQGPEKKTMPRDVYEWLKHLERIEKERVEITQDQLSDALVAMTKAKMGGAMEILQDMLKEDPDSPATPSPSADFSTAVQRLRDSWKDLTDHFNSVSPPDECRPIRDDYDQALRETGAMMMDVMDALANADSSPEAAIKSLRRMQGTSKGRIDAVAKSANRRVQEICDKYDTDKWFDIMGDVGSGLTGQSIGF